MDDEDRMIKVRASDWQSGADRIKELESALREIAEHPHIDCLELIRGPWDNPGDNGHFAYAHSDGHRCAAEIARKALGQ